MINIADLLAGRDDAAVSPLPVEAGQEPVPAPPETAGSSYPAKRLALQNGCYRAVDHDK